MTFTISALDTHYLLKEIRPLLQEAFIDKIYQGEQKGDFLIRARSPKHGKQQLYVKAPDALFLTTHRFSWPVSPPGFCMQLRKHLSNAKIVSINQHSFERIVVLEIIKGDRKWKLIIELFSKGNVVLVNNEGLIRGVMDLQRWKDRTLRVNAAYEFPPKQINTKTITAEEVQSLFDQSKKELVKFCATTLSLGGKYAEELLSNAKLPKEQKDITKKDAELIHMHLQKLLNQELQPVIAEGVASPFPLHNQVECQRKESYSHAIEELIVGQKQFTIEEEARMKNTSAKSKFQKIIDEQTNKLKGYELAGVENQRKGEIIYEHYQELKNFFETIQKLHKEKGWSQVREFCEEQKIPLTINEKNGLISFEIKS